MAGWLLGMPRILKTKASSVLADVKARTSSYARPAMDKILYNLPEAPWKETLLAVSVSAIVYYSLTLFLGGNELPAVDFNIPVPEKCHPSFAKAFQPSNGDEDDKSEEAPEILDEFGNINCWCPADGRKLGYRGIKPKDTQAIDTAVRRAKNAQPQWAKTTFAQRRQVLKTMLQYVLDHQDEIVTACCLDSGKTRVDALLGEILVTVEKLQWTISHGEKALAPSSRPTNFLLFYKSNTVVYEPLGVVAACVSWNYPFHNFISPIISAIFAGNAIVVKPSEQTAWSSIYFTNIVKGAIAQCGHSHNIVQTVVCLPEQANHLTSHPDLAHITFIGSRNVAHEVCKSAAKALIPVTVELGGKDPAIVLDDKKTVKDLPSIASILMRGVFQSAGQNCIGIERIIALPGVYEKIINIVLPCIKAMRLGSVLIDEYVPEPDKAENQGEAGNDDQSQEAGGTRSDAASERQRRSVDADATVHPAVAVPIEGAEPRTTDMGALISPARFATLEILIADAVRAGARLLTGGSRHHHPVYPRGSYFKPTLLADVTPSMKIAQTELFAPVFLLMKADNVDDAIEIANSTPYALGACVFGRYKKDVDRCVTEIKAGMVSVNDFAVYYATQMPFGGVKGSGYGRFAGKEGLRSLSNVKSVCRDRWPGLVQTKIPPLLDYPVRDAGVAWEMVQGIVELGYGGLRRKMTGLRRLLVAMRNGAGTEGMKLNAQDTSHQDGQEFEGKDEGSEEAVLVEKKMDLDAVD